MSRRISTKKRFSNKDLKYNSLLVNICINRLLKAGKKQLAKRIMYKALTLIQYRLNEDPLFILEKAIKNVSPRIQLASKHVDGTSYQLPILLTKFRSTNLAACWLIRAAKKRSSKGMILNLANEFLDAAKGTGSAVKKKEEIHKMAEANKAFVTYE